MLHSSHNTRPTGSEANPSHGGDVERIAREVGVSADDLLDFSANINPAGPPAAVLKRLAREAGDVRLLMRYPDIALNELRTAISTHAGVATANIVVANGAAALIDAAVRVATAAACDRGEAARCVVPVPAFSEYRRALVAAGCKMLPLPLNRDDDFCLDVDEFAAAITRHRPAMCIITNPHNPSGALIERQALERVVHAAQDAGSILLLDEAFIDYVPNESLTGAAPHSENLIVLRSLTKFYGLPALRVGYAVASGQLAARLHTQIPSWPVTTMAAGAAVEAINDAAYAAQTLESNAQERAWLSFALKGACPGFLSNVFPSAANFLLLETASTAPTVGHLRDRLIAKHRILVRDCSTYEGLTDGRFIRVAVRDRADNERLVAALDEARRVCYEAGVS